VFGTAFVHDDNRTARGLSAELLNQDPGVWPRLGKIGNGIAPRGGTAGFEGEAALAHARMPMKVYV
jgi:hypothetical protein